MWCAQTSKQRDIHVDIMAERGLIATTKHLHILILGAFKQMLTALRPPFALIVHVWFAAGWSHSSKIFPDVLYLCNLIENKIAWIGNIAPKNFLPHLKYLYYGFQNKQNKM